MRVVVWYFPGCPNWHEAGQRMRHALDELGHRDAMVRYVAVDPDTTEGGFVGSPTFTVDGDDLFPGPVPGAPSCRVYVTAAGLSGVPSVADLVAALRERTTS